MRETDVDVPTRAVLREVALIVGLGIGIMAIIGVVGYVAITVTPGWERGISSQGQMAVGSLLTGAAICFLAMGAIFLFGVFIWAPAKNRARQRMEDQ